MPESKRHPYIGLPDYQFWQKEPGISDPTLFDPVTHTPFKIDKQDKVVTAGSCFAQHVARHLKESGFNHLITENAHPLFSAGIAQKHNYGIFSARYGNVYTARQLKQLIQRAFNVFSPEQSSWKTSARAYVDPFRPQIQPNGFVSEAELCQDREQHLICVKEALEEADVFVFTLGLTEAWIDPRDGAVFPLAPGIVGGSYDASTIQFKNFSLAETIADLEYSLNQIREINPTVKIILTVSPVPLNATFENRHVYLSTTHSKAVLRLTAEEVCRNMIDTTYFPSYEIITSPFARGSYFENDCRSVTPAGVKAVMGVFLRNYSIDVSGSSLQQDNKFDVVNEHLANVESAIHALCDEEAIKNS